MNTIETREMIDYDKAREIISRFCDRQTAELFADRFSRFPDENTAAHILPELDKQAAWWSNRNAENAALCDSAILAIKAHI